MSRSKKSKAARDPAVEALRILGCFTVIGVHIKLSEYIGDTPDFSRTAIACFLSDGVTIFWFITGFFLFAKHDYPSLMKRTARQILLPMFLYTAFCFYLYPFFIGISSLADSIARPLQEYKSFFAYLTIWKQSVTGTGHLWYLYTYVFLMVLFPVLDSFTAYLSERPLRIRNFIAAIWVAFLLNDLRENCLLAFSLNSINALIPACIEVLWGYFLYQKKEEFQNNRFIPYIGLFLFLSVNLVRSVFQYRYFLHSPGNILYEPWYTSFSLIGTTGLCLFVLGIGQRLSAFQSQICFLSSYTFPIYLLHMLIIDKCNVLGFKQRFCDWSLQLSQGLWGELCYTIFYTIFIFLVSFFICLVGRRLLNAFAFRNQRQKQP